MCVEIYFLSILFNTLLARHYSAVSLKGICITDIMVSTGLVASVRNSLAGAATAPLRVGTGSPLLHLRQQIHPSLLGRESAESPLNSECHLLLLLELHFAAVRTRRAKEEHRREPENRER